MMSRKERKQWIKFIEANKDKECESCGCGFGEVALFEVHQIMDSKYVYDGEEILLCHNCMTNRDFIEFWSAMVRTKPKDASEVDIDEVDNNLNRKESKPHLCQICKLIETCQNNFDYECVEASDILCFDIKCGSYAECDKIHCHQFYEYTNKGIIRREPYKLCKKCDHFRTLIEGEGEPYPDCEVYESLDLKFEKKVDSCTRFIKKIKREVK